MKIINAKSIAALLLTACFVLWVAFIANQQSPALILAFFFLVLGTSAAVLRSRLTRWSPGRMRLVACAVAGAITGYIGAVVAVNVNECVLRGVICLQRDLWPNLYFFPLLSFGWLYGAAMYCVLLTAPVQPKNELGEENR